jgi:hypothetical protein
MLYRDVIPVCSDNTQTQSTERRSCGRVRKIAKTGIIFVMCDVCPSIRMEQLEFHWTSVTLLSN